MTNIVYLLLSSFLYNEVYCGGKVIFSHFIKDGQINDTKTQLTAAQSEYDYLASQMSNITSRTSLQQVAEGQLGLVQVDPSQVTYVQLEDESVIEKTSSSAEALFSDVRTAALNLLESLNP